MTRKFTLDDVKRAFEAGQVLNVRKNPWSLEYTRRTWEDYAATLKPEQPVKASGPEYCDCGCGAHAGEEQQPNALERHAEEAPYMLGYWQREHDRLLLEEVDKRINKVIEVIWWQKIEKETEERILKKVAKMVGQMK